MTIVQPPETLIAENPLLAMSPETGEIITALVTVLPLVGNITRDKEGKIELTKGGNYKFKYADLKQINDMAKPLLAEHGLGIMQPAFGQGAAAGACTLILHTSGQWMLFGGVPVPYRAGDPKAVGSSVSFSRRYSLAAALAISQQDDDADEASKPPKAEKAKAETVKLAQKKDRDALQARIEGLPASYSGQIGNNLRAQGITWNKISTDMLAEVTGWVVECEGLAAAEAEGQA